MSTESETPETLRSAAARARERGQAAESLRLYLQAAQRAEGTPTAARVKSSIDVELGELYERELGRLDLAVERYERAYKANPDDARAIEAGRRLYRARGDWQRVARLFEVELEAGQHTPAQKSALLVELGILLSERLGDVVQAAVRFEEAARINANDEVARERLAELYTSADFPGDGAPLERASRLLCELALMRRMKNDDEGELAFLRRALGADPYMVDAAVRLEQVLRARGKNDELKRLYRDAPLPNRPLKQAELLLHVGELDEAAEALVAAAEEGIEVEEPRRRLAALYTEKKAWAKLASLEERLSEVLGPDAEQLLALAKHHQQAGNLAGYENALRRALSLDPALDAALTMLQEHLVTRRDPNGIAAAWEAAVEASSIEDQRRRLAELADIYEKRVGDVAAAADAWRRAEAIVPSEKGASELKRLQQKEDRWAHLCAALEKELQGAQAAEQKADLLRRLAQVYRDRHQIDKARQLFEEAARLKPEDPAAVRALADLAEREGDFPSLAAAIRRQLGVSKEKVERLNLLRRLAVIYDERLDDTDELLWACSEILTALPGDRDALRRLEVAYEKSGAEEQLIGILEKHAQAAATPAEKVPLLLRLAALYESHDEPEKAAERLDRVLKLDKHDAAAQEGLARLYEKLGKWPEAALALERLVVNDDRRAEPGAAPQRASSSREAVPSGRPGSVDAWKRLARVVDGKLGDAVRATRAWNEVLQRRPSDREALEALARLYRTRGDWSHLNEILGRRQKIAEGEELAELALQRAHLADAHLHDKKGAIEILRALLDGAAPRNLKAHELLRKLERESGDLAASQRTAERELFLTEEQGARLALALEIATRWRDEGKDLVRAIAAFERVIEIDDTHEEGLAALSELYSLAGESEKLIAIDEQRLGLALDANNIPQAVVQLFELALTCEEQLRDAEGAFSYFQKAHDLDAASGALNELRRVAEAHGLWEKLCDVYAAMPGLEPRLQVAEIADQRLNDPKRAFAVVRGALDLDPSGEKIQAELERLSLRADDARGLLEIYDLLLQRRPEPAAQVALLEKRAQVKELRQKDAPGALDETLRAYALIPDDEKTLPELLRLGEVTRRWEDVLAVEGFRFHRAPDSDKLRIACEAAQLVEEKLQDRLRAFRAYLRAFMLSPEDETLRGHLWRLARLVDTIDESRKIELRPSAPPLPPPIPGGKKPRRDETQELELSDLDLEEVISRERRDPTVELSLMDLMKIQESEPINLFPEEKKQKHAPPPPPRAVSGQHSAWDELASVMMTLPAKDAAEQFNRLVAVAEMWERGAGDLGRAFDMLASAFRLNPDDPEARAALERLAQANDAWDRLVAVLDETIEETGEADRVVRLLIDSATVRAKQKQMADVEARLHRALGIQPACEEALTRLETLYRASDRLSDLTSLLERRLGGLLERLPPGDQRKMRALELADVYERLGNSYEAISAWQRVATENPDHEPAFASLARLYESVGQWSKVIESLTRQIDVLEAQKDSERARELRKRVGEIFLKELELPDRAAEAFAALHELNPADQEAEATLEKLYEKLGRWGELDGLLRKRGERWGDAAQKAAILERRATLLREKLHDDEGTLGVLQQLRRLRPEDDAIAARVVAAFQKLGKREEAMALLRERVAKAGPRKSELLVELAQLEADFGDYGAAQKSLEKALQEKPDDPRALAELARLREGGSDWDGYAAAREREAHVAATKEAAVRALLDAARVHLDKRKDDAAAQKALERALETDGSSIDTLGLLQNLYRRIKLIDRADELVKRELALSPAPERLAELQSLLGRSLLDKGEIEAATKLFREALALRPGWAPAVHGLVDAAVQTNAWEEVEALLKSATAKEGVPPEIAAQFYRRLGEANEYQGRPEEAYAALQEADRLLPGDLTTRLLMGENRYRGNRFREAAQHLTAVVEHPNAASLGKAGGEGAYHAALAELKLRRTDKAMQLVEIAVQLDPQHVAALGLLAERAIETGAVERALDLFERQAAATPTVSERLARFERVGDVIWSELRDEKRAMAAFERALEAGGENASTALLDKLLGLEREAGNLTRASDLAGKLIERATQKPERARRLREAAALDAALGKNDVAVERLRAALDLDPHAHEALAGLSALLVAKGSDEEAAQLLTRALPLLPAPEASARAGRAVLWMRLGECRERLRDAKGAMAAFEKALEADPTRRPLRESLLQRYGDDPSHDEVVRGHHLRILEEDPLHAPSLRPLARIDQKRPDQGRRFLELLVVSGAASDDEKRRLASAPVAIDESKVGSLAEEDHAALAHPDSVPLAQVFAAMWEGSSSMTPDLAALGVNAGNRVSPVDKTELALAYALAARILGNRKTGLYLKTGAAPGEVTVAAHPPTAIVVSPRLPEGRSAADVRFLLGRALEIARPEYVLAASLPREDFTKLFGALLRAFHPRHARRTGDDEAAAWRKQLPYKVARRLGELFRDLGDTHFSSVDWRRAVQHTGNRAGLLASGDLVAAARVLNGEGDSDAVRELARFAASDDYAALRTRLKL
jgi:tetratricopeptide (TPR) repeat protein